MGQGYPSRAGIRVIEDKRPRLPPFNTFALGEPMMDYAQAAYICCLDLGPWGAVIGRGWEREVSLTGDRAKKVKEYIKQKLIYPPDDALEALNLANPIGPDSDGLFQHILEVLEQS
ncbi:hypothetical protein diail_6109 [Diaporthe ilicicola]|nr:hypothetical protein diail_6109 [Diaporthe ilicicola]